MNSTKQLDTKSILRYQRHFSIPTMKLQKQKSGKKNPISYSYKKNKVPRNRPNEGDKTCTQKTTQHWRKKLRKTQINGSMYPVHGLEELTSSKMSYYPKHFIDSTQSLLKYQWHISWYRTNISKIYMEW